MDTEWTVATALADPRDFFAEYLGHYRVGRAHERDGARRRTDQEEDRLSDQVEILFDVLREVDDVAELLDFVQVGLAQCKTDDEVAYYAAGPIEDVVVHRQCLKTPEDIATFDQIVRRSPALASTFRDGLVWVSREEISAESAAMLEKWMPPGWD